jgi:hypothetical protein
MSNAGSNRGTVETAPQPASAALTLAAESLAWVTLRCFEA